MSVAKREVSLIEALGSYLSYTPNYRETDHFLTDLRAMNHTLLRDAIHECVKASKAQEGAHAQTKRQLLHSVYTRKVKELASLYPFLFAVENALRSVASERYQKAFKNAFWWRIFTVAQAQGKTYTDFRPRADGKKLVGVTPVNAAFIKEVFLGVKRMSHRQKSSLNDEKAGAVRFYEELTLKNLANIIAADWSLCSLGDLKKSDFTDHMRVICDARNEIFHGNPVKTRAKVFTACERILDSVDFHLGDFDQALRQVSYTRPSPTLPRIERHCIPPSP